MTSKTKVTVKTLWGLPSLIFTLLSGCSTFEFVNGPELNETTKYERWHQMGLYGLVSFSQPLNVVEQCAEQQWESITIEKTFFNSLAGVNYPWIDLYSPWTTVYECRPAIDSVN